MQLKWTGNSGSGTSGYSAYRRDHELSAPAKSAPLLMTSDPAFRGNPALYTPEELLLGSLSSCHMLWFLHLCAVDGVVVTGYTDAPAGVMAEHESGAGEFTRVVLRPCVTLADTAREAELEAIHHRAHEMCFISRSVNFEVCIEPA